MEVNELVKSGAHVDIRFHDCTTLDEAYKRLDPYKHLGKVVLSCQDDTFWATIEAGQIRITAFYDKEAKK